MQTHTTGTPTPPTPASSPPQSPRPPRRRRPRAYSRLVVAAGLLVLVGGGGAGWYSLAHARAGAGAGQPTLDTFQVAFTSFDIATTSSGELEAKNQIIVRSELEISSTIVEVIEEGKLVKKGDVLIRLNSDQVQTSLTDVTLRVEASKTELEKAETACKIQEKENASKLSQAHLKVTLAELGFKQWDEGDKVQKAEDHKRAIEKGLKEKIRLKEKFDKCAALLEKGFVSRDEMKRDELDYEDAVRAFDKAELARDIFEKYEIPKDKAKLESDVQQAKEELERVEAQASIELKSKESERISCQRKLDTNNDHLAKLQRQLEKSTIIAPADGLAVYATSMERSRYGWGGEGPLAIGRQVHPNEELIMLPDTTEMVASVRVHETLASKIHEGLPASVKVDAVGGRTFTAKVQSIGILAEASGWRDPNLREYTVKLSIADAEGVELKPSMRCEAEIVMGHVDNALAIPIQAVHNDGMLRFVHVQSDTSASKYVRRPVKLGRISEALAEVPVGLQDGERILLRRPSPGEVIDREFSDTELTGVGLKRGSSGQLEMADGSKGPGNKGPKRGGKPAADVAGKKPAATDDAAKKTDAPKPEAAKPETKPEAVKPEAPKTEGTTGSTSDTKTNSGAETASAKKD